eukprot:gene25905-11581_t
MKAASKTGAGRRGGMRVGAAPPMPIWGSRQAGKLRKKATKAAFDYDKLALLPKCPLIKWKGDESWDLLTGALTQQHKLLEVETEMVTSWEPTSIYDGIIFNSVGAGTHHGVASGEGNASRYVYTWGSNNMGQLGTGCHEYKVVSKQKAMLVKEVPAPVDISPLMASLPASLQMGMQDSEDGSEATSLAPPSASIESQAGVLIMYRLSIGHSVKLVACGDCHTIAALELGGAMAWGANDHGQLGVPPPLRYNKDPVYKDTPLMIKAIGKTVLVHLSAGVNHSAAVTAAGAVWTWGDGRCGKCGTGLPMPSQPPSEMQLGPKSANNLAVQVACGTDHTLVLTSRGKVFSFGSNKRYQLGFEGLCDWHKPVVVPTLPPVMYISASSISAAVTSQGQLLIWGYDRFLNPNPYRERSPTPEGPDVCHDSFDSNSKESWGVEMHRAFKPAGSQSMPAARHCFSSIHDDPEQVSPSQPTPDSNSQQLSGPGSESGFRFEATALAPDSNSNSQQLSGPGSESGFRFEATALASDCNSNSQQLSGPESESGFRFESPALASESSSNSQEPMGPQSGFGFKFESPASTEKGPSQPVDFFSWSAPPSAGKTLTLSGKSSSPSVPRTSILTPVDHNPAAANSVSFSFGPPSPPSDSLPPPPPPPPHPVMFPPGFRTPTSTHHDPAAANSVSFEPPPPPPVMSPPPSPPPPSFTPSGQSVSFSGPDNTNDVTASLSSAPSAPSVSFRGPGNANDETASLSFAPSVSCVSFSGPDNANDETASLSFAPSMSSRSATIKGLQISGRPHSGPPIQEPTIQAVMWLYPHEISKEPIIQAVMWLYPHEIRTVALGRTHAVVVTTWDMMYCWGEGAALGYSAISGSWRVQMSDEELKLKHEAAQEELCKRHSSSESSDFQFFASPTSPRVSEPGSEADGFQAFNLGACSSAAAVGYTGRRVDSGGSKTIASNTTRHTYRHTSLCPPAGDFQAFNLGASSRGEFQGFNLGASSSAAAKARRLDGVGSKTMPSKSARELEPILEFEHSLQPELSAASGLAGLAVEASTIWKKRLPSNDGAFSQDIGYLGACPSRINQNPDCGVWQIFPPYSRNNLTQSQNQSYDGRATLDSLGSFASDATAEKPWYYDSGSDIASFHSGEPDYVIAEIRVFNQKVTVSLFVDYKPHTPKADPEILTEFPELVKVGPSELRMAISSTEQRVAMPDLDAGLLNPTSQNAASPRQAHHTGLLSSPIASFTHRGSNPGSSQPASKPGDPKAGSPKASTPKASPSASISKDPTAYAASPNGAPGTPGTKDHRNSQAPRNVDIHEEEEEEEEESKYNGLHFASQLRPSPLLLPRKESPFIIAAGHGHTVCLCASSSYIPSEAELGGLMASIIDQFVQQFHAQYTDQIAAGIFAHPPGMTPEELDELIVSVTAAKELAGREDEATPLINLEMAVIFCRLVGLFDNQTELLDIRNAMAAQVTKKQATVSLQGVVDNLATARKKKDAGKALQPSSSSKYALDKRRQSHDSALNPGSKDGNNMYLDKAQRLNRIKETVTRVTQSQEGSVLTKAAREKMLLVDAVPKDPPPDAPTISDTNQLLNAQEFISMLLDLVRDRNPKLLARRHIIKLRSMENTGFSWLLDKALKPQVSLLLDGGEHSELLHRVYTYMAGAEGQPADLNMSLRDARLGLKQQGKNFTIPFLRVAQFLRYTGIMPRLLSRMITQTQEEAENNLKLVPKDEQVPWWWPGSSERKMANMIPTLGAFRFCPKTVAPMQNAVVMGLVNEYDILGVPIPRSRKIFKTMLTSEMLVQLQHRRRDRLVAYCLLDLLGDSLINITHPDQLKPSYVMAQSITYPQFVEVLSVCCVLQAIAKTGDAGFVYADVSEGLPKLDIATTAAGMVENVRQWRERILFPWKFKRQKHNDVELESEVDKIFRLYCSIDPIHDSVSLSIYEYNRLVEDCGIPDDLLTQDRINQDGINQIFLISGRLDPTTLSGFGELSEEDQLNAALLLQLQAQQGSVNHDGHKDTHMWELGEGGKSWQKVKIKGITENYPQAALEIPKITAQLTSSSVSMYADPMERLAARSQDWSGLSAAQLRRLQTSRLALAVAEQSLEDTKANAAYYAALTSKRKAFAERQASMAVQGPCNGVFLNGVLQPLKNFEPTQGTGSESDTSASPPDINSLRIAVPSDSEDDLELGTHASPGRKRLARARQSATAAGWLDWRSWLRPMSQAEQNLLPQGPNTCLPREGGSTETSMDPANAAAEAAISAEASSMILAALRDPVLARAFRPPTRESSPTRSRSNSPTRGGRCRLNSQSSPLAVSPDRRRGLARSTGTLNTPPTQRMMSPPHRTSYGLPLESAFYNMGARIAVEDGGVRGVGHRDGMLQSWPSFDTDDYQMSPPLSPTRVRPSNGTDSARTTGDGQLSTRTTGDGELSARTADASIDLSRMQSEISLKTKSLTSRSPRRTSDTTSTHGSHKASKGYKPSENNFPLTFSFYPGEQSDGPPAGGLGRSAALLPNSMKTVWKAPHSPPSQDQMGVSQSSMKVSTGATGSSGPSLQAEPYLGEFVQSGFWPGGGEEFAHGSNRDVSGVVRTPPFSPGMEEGGDNGLGPPVKPGSPSASPYANFERSLLETPPSPGVAAAGGGRSASPKPVLKLSKDDSLHKTSLERTVNFFGQKIVMRKTANASASSSDEPPPQSDSQPGSDSSAESQEESSSVLSRLTTTRKSLMEAAATTGTGSFANPFELYSTKLDRKQFGEALRRLAVSKYAKISAPIAAWRVLVERHIVPAAQTRDTRFDQYVQRLMGPSIISLVLAWEPQTKGTRFDQYVQRLMGPSIVSLVLAWEPQFEVYGQEEMKKAAAKLKRQFEFYGQERMKKKAAVVVPPPPASEGTTDVEISSEDDTRPPGDLKGVKNLDHLTPCSKNFDHLDTVSKNPLTIDHLSLRTSAIDHLSLNNLNIRPLSLEQSDI